MDVAGAPCSTTSTTAAAAAAPSTNQLQASSLPPDVRSSAGSSALCHVRVFTKEHLSYLAIEACRLPHARGRRETL